MEVVGTLVSYIQSNAELWLEDVGGHSSLVVYSYMDPIYNMVSQFLFALADPVIILLRGTNHGPS